MGRQPTRMECKAYVKRWRELGPLLEELRTRELREFDYRKNWRQIDALMTLGEAHREPRPMCGLVEQQRLFAKLRK